MNLFERDIEVKARENGDGITVEAYLTDTFHEMSLTADFTHPDLVITRVEGKIIRYPHEECLPGEDTLKGVVGVKAGRELFQKIERVYGGASGCVHLLNLLYQAGLAAVQARFAKTRPFSPEEWESLPKPMRINAILRFQPGMRNSCIAWSNASPMVRAADALSETDSKK